MSVKDNSLLKLIESCDTDSILQYIRNTFGIANLYKNYILSYKGIYKNTDVYGQMGFCLVNQLDFTDVYLICSGYLPRNKYTLFQIENALNIDESKKLEYIEHNWEVINQLYINKMEGITITELGLKKHPKINELNSNFILSIIEEIKYFNYLSIKNRVPSNGLMGHSESIFWKHLISFTGIDEEIISKGIKKESLIELSVGFAVDKSFEKRTVIAEHYINKFNLSLDFYENDKAIRVMFKNHNSTFVLLKNERSI